MLPPQPYQSGQMAVELLFRRHQWELLQFLGGVLNMFEFGWEGPGSEHYGLVYSLLVEDKTRLLDRPD
nr:hypothetical protein BaRGS_014517 [Batillaria attramentaria]